MSMRHFGSFIQGLTEALSSPRRSDWPALWAVLARITVSSDAAGHQETPFGVELSEQECVRSFLFPSAYCVWLPATAV